MNIGGRVNLITRFGTKTQDIKFFEKYLPLNVKTVVEPFGGAFAVVRDIYGDDKYKKYVNDLDPSLFYVYKNPAKLVKGFEVWNKIYDDKKLKTTKEKVEKFNATKLNNLLKGYILQNIVVRGSLAHKKNLDDVKSDLNFIKKITFSHMDAFKFMDKFLENKNAFIFLDPPYLFSNNELYAPQKDEQDNTDYYAKFYNILSSKKTKAKIMLIINDLKILRWIFKDFIVGDYEKFYNISKKKTRHLIITNY